MARRIRASQLALKLDVIVEESDQSWSPEITRPVELLPKVQEDIPNTATYAITLQSSKTSSGNDPLFLHTGRWPSMDMMDQILESSAMFSNSDLSAKPISIDHSTSQQQQSEQADSDSETGDNWRWITADQLSMAVDLWDPDEDIFTIPTLSKHTAQDDTLSNQEQFPTMTVAQQALFRSEVTSEHLTRTQTVDHLEELEDNDSAIEVVATLEGYRQTGWAEEMIKAFPCQCWMFWCDSGLGSKPQIRKDSNPGA